MKYTSLVILVLFIFSCSILNNKKVVQTPKQIRTTGVIEIEFIRFSEFYCLNKIYFYPDNLVTKSLDQDKYFILPSRYYNYKIIKQNPAFEYYLGNASDYYYSDSIYAFDIFNLKEVGQNIIPHSIVYNSTCFYNKGDNDSILYLLFSIDTKGIYYPYLNIDKLIETNIIPEIPCDYSYINEKLGFIVIDSIITSNSFIDSKFSKPYHKSMVTKIKSPILY